MAFANFNKACQAAKRKAQRNVNPSIEGFAVWYDCDFNNFHISDSQELQELCERRFIESKDIVASYEG